MLKKKKDLKQGKILRFNKAGVCGKKKTSRDIHLRIAKKKQVDSKYCQGLVRMWKHCDFHTLLVVIYIGTTISENCLTQLLKLSLCIPIN